VLPVHGIAKLPVSGPPLVATPAGELAIDSAASQRKRVARDLAFVAALAFAIRVVHAAFIARTPFFEGPVIDAQVYWSFAKQLAETGDFGGPFYQPPLYPALLAALFRVGLGSAWSIAIAQSAMGAATAALLLLVGRRLAAPGRERALGLTTGAIAAAYGPFVLFDLEILPPSVVLLLFSRALLLALRSGPLRTGDAGMGLLLGAAVTGWPLISVLAPGVCALRVRRSPSGPAAAAIIAVVLASCAPPILLTAHHNARQGGQGIVVSYNSGINLWLGNSPHWRDTWRARPGAAFEPELERPDREGVTQPAERSRYFVQRVWRDVAARPLAAAARTAEKLYYVWHGREIRRNQDIALLRRASPVLSLLLWEAGVAFPFGIVAPLAWLGIWRRRRDPDTRILAASAAAYAVVLATFFAAARYRLPLVLLLLPLAADELCHLIRLGRRATGRVPALLACGVVLNLPVAFTKSFAADDAELGILHAHAWRNQGKWDEAAAISEALVQRFPRDANVQMLRAELLEAQDRCDLARAHLQRVTELAPRAAMPWVMLASCFDALGDAHAAERAFASALSLHPHHPVALKRAGLLYARYGRMIEARSLFTRFVKSGYRDPEVDARLAELARQLGR
jgi:tetratricopeptide (TPR) repeat protein